MRMMRVGMEITERNTIPLMGWIGTETRRLLEYLMAVTRVLKYFLIRNFLEVARFVGGLIRNLSKRARLEPIYSVFRGLRIVMS